MKYIIITIAFLLGVFFHQEFTLLTKGIVNGINEKVSFRLSIDTGKDKKEISFNEKNTEIKTIASIIETEQTKTIQNPIDNSIKEHGNEKDANLIDKNIIPENGNDFDGVSFDTGHNFNKVILGNFILLNESNKLDTIKLDKIYNSNKFIFSYNGKQFFIYYINASNKTKLNSLYFIEKFLTNFNPELLNKKEYKLYIEINPESDRRGKFYTADSTIELKNDIEDFQKRNVWMHEFGHFVDLILLQGDAKTKDQNFTEFGKAVNSIDDYSLFYYEICWDGEKNIKEECKTKNMPSIYSMQNDVYEDFAEMFLLYLLYGEKVRTYEHKDSLLAEKLRYMDFLFLTEFKDYNSYVTTDGIKKLKTLQVRDVTTFDGK